MRGWQGGHPPSPPTAQPPDGRREGDGGANRRGPRRRRARGRGARAALLPEILTRQQRDYYMGQVLVLEAAMQYLQQSALASHADRAGAPRPAAPGPRTAFDPAWLADAFRLHGADADNFAALASTGAFDPAWLADIFTWPRAHADTFVALGGYRGAQAQNAADGREDTNGGASRRGRWKPRKRGVGAATAASEHDLVDPREQEELLVRIAALQEGMRPLAQLVFSLLPHGAGGAHGDSTCWPSMASDTSETDSVATWDAEDFAVERRRPAARSPQDLPNVAKVVIYDRAEGGPPVLRKTWSAPLL